MNLTVFFLAMALGSTVVEIERRYSAGDPLFYPSSILVFCVALLILERTQERSRRAINTQDATTE